MAMIMNKNVMHNGASYAKGAEIKKGDPGFEELCKAGHAEEGIIKVAVKPEEKPVEPVAPIPKSKK